MQLCNCKISEGVIFVKRKDMTIVKDNFSVSTDISRLDINVIHGFLTSSYWAENIPVETVRKSIEGSMCFGVYDENRQIGFARMITDKATFAYLADVFILEEYRGRGLSKWLMEIIMNSPELQGLRRIMLATRDAHGLYKKSGFTPLTQPNRWMQIHNPDIYKKAH
jgi:N-acetylglutamate synthase-like GNAT family acetyltransferase